MKQNLIENNLDIVYDNQRIIKKYKTEIFSFLVYSSLLTLVMYYHEPWLDEAQAWLIARDATISELLKNVTHYEGHPPLWFIILMPFAKSRIPFEIGLKVVNFVIVNISTAIFLFKAPFNRFIRCSVPFTYFFFYQYGVISRPYSLLILGFILSAMYFKKRNEKPLRLTVSLILLCSSSAYGIVISFGIVIFWIYENIIQFYKIRLPIKKTKELFISWTMLFVFNIILLLIIYPHEDTFAINVSKVSWLSNIIYIFLAAPMEALFTNSIFIDLDKLGSSYYSFILAGGILLNLLFILITLKYKKIGLFLIPYALFSIFSSVVYFSSHHIGIIMFFYIFIIWCCLDENICEVCEKEIINSYKKFFIITANIIAVFSIIISIYWTLSSATYDYKNNYGNGRDLYDFITHYDLDKQNIYVAWYPLSVDDETEIYDYNLLSGIPALAYFNKNIFCNFNERSNDKRYLLHKINSDGNYIDNLIRESPPEVLLISNRIQYTFGKAINNEDFALVKIIKANMIWKDSSHEFEDYIYIRKNLLSYYPELEEIKTQ